MTRITSNKNNASEPSLTSNANKTHTKHKTDKVYMEAENNYICSIPQLVKDGKVTKKQARDHISSLLLTHPTFFMLQKRSEKTEELHSQIIVRFIETFDTYFDRYNPNLSNFVSYLRNLISYMKKSAKTKMGIEKIENGKECLSGIAIEEGFCDHYTKNDYDCEIEKIKVCRFEQKVQENPPTKSQKSSPHKIYDIENGIKALSDVKKKTLITLALKTSYFIEDWMLEKIAKYCNVNFNTLLEMKETLKKSIEPSRIKNYKSLQQKINSRFARYNFWNMTSVILNEDEVDEYKEENAKRKCDYFKRILHNSEKELALISQNLAPTNKELSHLLKVSERHIGNYLLYAQKYFDEYKNDLEIVE